MEELLGLIEKWPKEEFTKQRKQIEKESEGDKVKMYIREMKKSILKKGLEESLARVDKILMKIGIQDRHTSTQAYKETKLMELHGQILEHFRNRDWPGFDGAQGEVNSIVSRVHGLKDTFLYEECIRFRIASYEIRKDQGQMLEALERHI